MSLNENNDISIADQRSPVTSISPWKLSSSIFWQMDIRSSSSHTLSISHGWKFRRRNLFFRVIVAMTRETAPWAKGLAASSSFSSSSWRRRRKKRRRRRRVEEKRPRIHSAHFSAAAHARTDEWKQFVTAVPLMNDSRGSGSLGFESAAS